MGKEDLKKIVKVAVLRYSENSRNPEVLLIGDENNQGVLQRKMGVEDKYPIDVATRILQQIGLDSRKLSHLHSYPREHRNQVLILFAMMVDPLLELDLPPDALWAEVGSNGKLIEGDQSLIPYDDILISTAFKHFDNARRAI